MARGSCDNPNSEQNTSYPEIVPGARSLLSEQSMSSFLTESLNTMPPGGHGSEEPIVEEWEGSPGRFV